MKEFIEFRDLERVSGSSGSDFLRIISRDLNEQNIEYVIERLKLSGICVDIYGTHKYQEILDSATAIINARTTKPIIALQRLLNNVKLFNMLFQDFDNLREQTGVNKIPAYSQIPALLITGEIFLSSLQDYSRGLDLRILETKYPFVIAFGKDNGSLAPPEKVLNEIIDLNEKVMEQIGIVMKYLYHKDVPTYGLDALVSKDEIKICRQHFDLLGRYETLLHIYEHWRFWGGNLFPETASKINFKYQNENDHYSQRIAVFRSRILRNKWMHDFQLYIDKLPVDPKTESLPPTDFRTNNEYLSVSFCRELFGSVDLKEKILNITLAEWIRAYTILQQLSEDFLAKRDGAKKLSVREWCIVRSKDEWIETLILNGIDQIGAKIIVENLIFNRTAKDLFDCPFISLGDSLVILPSLVSFISPVDAMLSNFYNKELALNFRGRGLELKVIEMLSTQNIIGKNIKTSNGSDEYECDVVFVLDHDLYFIECKTFLQPETPRRYYEYIGKLTEAANQLNRISSYLETNLNVVKTSLNLDNDWKANHIHKIIVSSALVGEPFFINDCYITDASNLKRFFDRESPGFSIGMVRVSPQDHNYEGKVTSDKLLNIIKDPPPIKIAQRMMKRKYNNMTLSGYSLAFYNFDESEMVVADEKALRKLAKKLRVPYKFLEKKIDGK